MDRFRLLVLAAVATAALVAGGCSMTPTATSRSTIEQRLIARSLERALAQLDVSAFHDKRVFVDLAALTGDQTYARTFVIAELRQRGMRVVGDSSEAEVRVQVIAAGLGVDLGETLIGVPATTVPIVGMTIPEIALFKWTRHRGTSEIKLFAYDHDGRAVETPASALGESQYSQFTVLLILRFSRDDLDQPPPAPPPSR
jgi:hypothetical protein